MRLLRLLAYPVVPIYYIITWIRNVLYDKGILKITSFDLPIICVGNLSVGGTGKTPMIEYLIQLISSHYNVATLSRGYKRRTRGFVLANDSCNANDIGDEPFQFYNKFKDRILVAVSENRVEGVRKLLELTNKPKVILLDDAFQHRRIHADFNILLTVYSNLYVDDVVLPVGDLREPKNGAKRANIIIVTKCPKDMTEAHKIDIRHKLRPDYNQHVFFSHIEYSDSVISLQDKRTIESMHGVTLVTGIANPKPLVDFLNSKSLEFEQLKFSDHHNFTENDIALLEQKELILTTEKDYVRLKDYDSLKGKLYYLPIEMKIDDSELLNSTIFDLIARY